MNYSNLPSVDVNTFREIVKAQLNEENYRPIFGLGKGGIGKTESIMELAKEEELGYIDIRLLLYTETDLKGIPYPNADNTASVWLQNNILPVEKRDGEKGILVFDEITSCAKSVRTAAYQLLNERRLGEYQLPSKWIVVCLGNGPEDGGDFSGMEGNFLNRCSVFNITEDITGWCNWAFKHGVNELIPAFIRFSNGDFHTYNPESESDIELFASPRSWKAVSDIINMPGTDISNPLTFLRIAANIGIDVAQRFRAFGLYREKAINPDDILRGVANIQIDDREAAMITLNALEKRMIDVVKAAKAEGTPISDNTKALVANAFKWIANFSSVGTEELRAMAIKGIVNYDNDFYRQVVLAPGFLQMCPEFAQLSAKYAEVFR